ncbi:Receptor expression-enhancing protein 4 [Wickerhamiella sorbophila]|uniref:Protein YOP1 n=1 Tax=Wickerhamiella sorbophila TaxID=45607 RepID=A0A2T0FPE2_9ASCO|nr:Receptor expression-enhancing protein 4 [Wickerhamiella sorbophila]PRT56829.1 Receptor expression-enhancing protein 4 [Wickerhamiella sorbophila]
MFGLFSSLSACTVSLVFPVIASYKALAANDLSLLRPWLMYWIVLGVGLSFEAMFEPLLRLVPLYGYLRFFTLLWLVLPQTKGAIFLYTSYFEPWLDQHNGALDAFAVNAYIRVRNIVAHYLNSYLGFSIAMTELSGSDQTAPDQQVLSISQSLYSRFSLPVPSDYKLGAFLANWKSPPKAPKAYQEKYSKLLELAASLEKLRDDGLDSDGYDVIDSSAVSTGLPASPNTEAKRRGWW